MDELNYFDEKPSSFKLDRAEYPYEDNDVDSVLRGFGCVENYDAVLHEFNI